MVLRVDQYWLFLCLLLAFGLTKKFYCTGAIDLTGVFQLGAWSIFLIMFGPGYIVVGLTEENFLSHLKKALADLKIPYKVVQPEIYLGDEQKIIIGEKGLVWCYGGRWSTSVRSRFISSKLLRKIIEKILEQEQKESRNKDEI